MDGQTLEKWIAFFIKGKNIVIHQSSLKDIIIDYMIIDSQSLLNGIVINFLDNDLSVSAYYVMPWKFQNKIY